jgi:uncharacterized membrane protein
MTKSSKIDSTPGGERSKVLALSAVLSAIVAVLTFIIIPVPPPVGGFDASSILILSLPILLGAELGTIIVCVGEFVGTLFLLAAGLALPYYLPGIVAVRGPEAYIVGTIARSGLFGKGRERTRQLFAATLGPIWETAGFIIANYYLYYLFYGPGTAVVASLALIFTLIDLLWVLPAMAVVSAIRNGFKTVYLESQLGLDAKSGAKKNLFRLSAILIILTWILLLLIPYIFRNWFG